ncbi:MAG: YopX family protein [Candidatus Paceibacterota bacterium]
MTPLRFRAWHTAEKKLGWVTGLSFAANGILMVGVKWNDGSIGMYSPDEVILMQSTGLKDKNGVEIFEGDVIQDGDELTNYEVLWEDDCACFGGWNKDGWIGMPDLMQCEVIGNIYQNPELLKPAESGN